MFNALTTVWPSAARRLLCTAALAATVCGPVAAAKARKTAATAQPGEVPVNRVVAVIDREIITEHELLEKAQGHLEAALAGTSGHELAEARRQVLHKVLEQEIGERLLERELAANKDKLGVTEKEVDKATEEVMRQNHISKDQLQAALYGQGLSMGEYRDKLRGQIERARLMQFKVQSRVAVKDSDVRRRCLERQRLGTQSTAVCAGHVLLAVPDTADKKQRHALYAKAEQIRDRLRKGESLAALAEQYSDDPGASDGNLGCFHRGEMVESFEEAAFSLPDGAVSDVVQTTFGLHVIKVFSHRRDEASGCDDPQVLEGIKGELLQQEMARQMQVWLGELRKAAFVDVRL